MNELLARIHYYRDDENSNYAVLRFSLTQSRIISEDDGLPCKVFSKYVGKGDCVLIARSTIFVSIRKITDELKNFEKV